MTKSLLRNWDTFPKEKLKLSFQAELDRTKGVALTLEEKQLLDAAHARLLTWKEPSRRGNIMKIDDAAAPAPAAEQNQTPEAKKAKRSAPAKKASAKKESTAMAKKTKAKTPAKAKKSSANGERIPADAKIVAVKGKDNPFREGSGAYERTELVVKNSGKTREAIERLKGILSTTVPNLVKAGVVRVA